MRAAASTQVGAGVVVCHRLFIYPYAQAIDARA